MTNNEEQTIQIFDRNGKLIKVGQIVRVHQDDNTFAAKVVGLSDSPTVNMPGFWVDIDNGLGHEGMPSYLIEVI